MSFPATVIPVMIASPGDVHHYRAIATDILHEWNYIHSESTGVVLMPVAWETHSSPELGASAQELINNRVLKDCDLLIGIFWTRLGTPTLNAPSGSAEEIQRHVKAGKPAMVYFSDQPVALGSVDMAQYEALKQFRQWCEASGIVGTFFYPEDLRAKLSRQVQITLRDNPYLMEIVATAQTGYDSNRPGEARSPVVSLSTEAKELLQAAANDPQAMIISVQGVDHYAISVGNHGFGDPHDRRVMSKWEYGIEELLNLDLVRREGGRPGLATYRLTEPRYRAAEQLSASR